MVSFLNHIASILSERGLRCGNVYHPLYICPEQRKVAQMFILCNDLIITLPYFGIQLIIELIIAMEKV